MATLSEESVNAALESYEKGVMLRPQIFEYSEKLRILQLEVADFATELIARYQPVARDLRFIQSCMDVAYGFSRFGRYAYDISDVLEAIGPIPDCDKSYVIEMANTAKNMIKLSVESLKKLDKDTSQKLYMMDDSVDALYRSYIEIRAYTTGQRICLCRSKVFYLCPANTKIFRKNCRPCLLYQRLCSLHSHC